MGKRNTPVSKEFADTHGLKIETLPQYCQRVFISKSGAMGRINSNKAYGFKMNGRWFIVSKNGEDIKFIIF